MCTWINVKEQLNTKLKYKNQTFLILSYGKLKSWQTDKMEIFQQYFNSISKLQAARNHKAHNTNSIINKNEVLTLLKPQIIKGIFNSKYKKKSILKEYSKK